MYRTSYRNGFNQPKPFHKVELKVTDGRFKRKEKVFDVADKWRREWRWQLMLRSRALRIETPTFTFGRSKYWRMKLVAAARDRSDSTDSLLYDCMTSKAEWVGLTDSPKLQKVMECPALAIGEALHLLAANCETPQTRSGPKTARQEEMGWDSCKRVF